MTDLGSEDPIEIGRVGKPHGIRGGFYLDGAIDAPALVPGFELTIDGTAYHVASRGGTDARPIVVVEELSDRDAASALRGQPVVAPRGSLTPLGEGEWYAADLEGLQVVGSRGEEIGTVRRLTNAPSVDLLEVEPVDGEEAVLLPMIGDAIVEIDPSAGRIVVDTEFLNLG